MPWVPLAVMAVSAASSVYGSIQGEKAQKEMQQAKSNMENLKAARERTQQVREASAKRADIAQRSINEGAGQSSSAQTGAAGVSQEAYGNIQYLGFEQQTGEAISKAQQKDLDAQGIQSVAGGVGKIAGAVSDNYKELFGGADSVFG